MNTNPILFLWDGNLFNIEDECFRKLGRRRLRQEASVPRMIECTCFADIGIKIIDICLKQEVP